MVNGADSRPLPIEIEYERLVPVPEIPIITVASCFPLELFSLTSATGPQLNPPKLGQVFLVTLTVLSLYANWPETVKKAAESPISCASLTEPSKVVDNM